MFVIKRNYFMIYNERLEQKCHISPFLGVVELLFVWIVTEGDVVVNDERLDGEGEENTGVDVINVVLGEDAFVFDSFLGVEGEELLLLFDTAWWEGELVYINKKIDKLVNFYDDCFKFLIFFTMI